MVVEHFMVTTEHFVWQPHQEVINFGSEDTEKGSPKLPQDHKKNADAPWNNKFDELARLVQIILRLDVEFVLFVVGDRFFERVGIVLRICSSLLLVLPVFRRASNLLPSVIDIFCFKGVRRRWLILQKL